MTDLGPRREAALDWLVRTNDPEFDAWDEFTAWLERDPANADAYHALAGSEAEMRPLVERAAAPRPVERRVPRRFALVTGAAAAAAVAALLVTPRLQPIDYVTAPGEVRVVSLDGRDRLVMNGGTRLSLTGLAHRTIRLDEGQVLLRLEEPGASKFALVSGDLTLVDVGTVFEVSREGHETRVLVSEGAIVADPKGAALRLDAGERLDTHDGAEVLKAVAGSVDSVGAFTQGQLTYVDEPIENVVADLRRSTGLDFSTSEAIRARRFTGTLSIAEVRRDPQALGPLLGVALQRSGRGWELQGKA